MTPQRCGFRRGISVRFLSARFLSIVFLSVILLGTSSACESPRTTGGTIRVQVSGEDLGYGGIAFPGDPTITDGWKISFDHVLVTFGNVRLSENPDQAPSDPSITGKVVAQASGPWIADLAVRGSETGADGSSRATAVTVFRNQNANGGASFATDQRYAFSYDTVAALPSAERLDVPDSAEPFIEKMVEAHYSVLYVGTATFEGGTDCKTTDPTYFANGFPTTVRFELGFATPTSYENCQNQNNDGEPLDGESYQRGVAVKANAEAVAQITFHLDHPFFGDVEHDPKLFFDAFAAALVNQPQGTVLRLEDLSAVDPTAITDATGRPLPWRTCDGSDLPEGAQRSVSTGSLPVDPVASPSVALRGYADFARYVQSTQGHMNGGEGLCFVKRNYPSPL